MRTRAQVSPDKLRGGFYTPAPLVHACLERAAKLVDGGPLRVLEPSAGDGAFLRALAAPPWRERLARVLAIEPVDAPDAPVPLEILRASAVPWAAAATEEFDLAVGNPPFVRYQFVAAADRIAATALGARLGVPLAGVGNLWIPVLLGALGRLREGGAFAFVVPAECLTGCAAAAVRGWLLARCRDVACDPYPAGAFPGVLQDVVILSGRRGAGGSRAVRIGGRASTVDGDGPWTRYLLAPSQRGALEACAGVPRLGDVAAFEVATVTGANAFFCADAVTVAAHGLEPWARPLLPRIRHAEGLVYTAADHARTRAAGARTALLDFASPDPLGSPGAAAYLAAGRGEDLPARYKCRIREPWYRVPVVAPGALLLSKRSHHHPRVVLNAAGVHTTDTIYRGRTTGGLPAEALAAAFHNSLTLLTAELEGRSFAGGVLELVPSEIARLRVPAVPALAAALPGLDRLARRDPGALVPATDALLCRHGLLDPALLGELRAARAALADRRMPRAVAA